MTQTFFWYDLETTGVNPREGRIMQFAGQRTDMNLQPIDEPVNLLIKLTEDILPDPQAVLITGITPQQTLQDGVSEVEFLRLFHEQVAVPSTIFVGYNTVRFDDEFMRYLNYRNFYDPYQWEWQNERGRWDLLDVVRMTRALRPEGIKWPMTDDGKPTNRLELITKLNGLDHEQAHDALNDVLASIAVAKLIRSKQPKLFDWLLSVRTKKAVEKVVESGQPFIYTSAKYGSAYEKTTVVQRIAAHPTRSGSLVYDLRHDPTSFIGLSPETLAERWQYSRDADAPARLPIKTLQYNRCPAVAPLGTLTAAPAHIAVPLETIQKHRALLLANPEFVTNVLRAQQLLDDQQAAKQIVEQPVDARLYEGFLDDHDAKLLAVVRAAQPDELIELATDFHDTRMQELLPLYKARNFANLLSDEERTTWEQYRYHMLIDGGTESKLASHMHQLSELATSVTDADKRYLLEELQLYAESIMPVIDNE